MPKYSPLLLRIAISLVFLWFGANQLINPENFIGYLPGFITTLDSAKTAVILNGIFEAVFGLLLLLGIFTRPVALLLGLNLLAITFSLGYNEIAVRDFGLALACFAVALNGNDQWCLNNKLKKQ